MNDDEFHELLAQEIERRFSSRLFACESLAPGLGTRRFFRLSLTGGRDDACPEHMIARVEAPEDPSKRPQHAAPEPDLEPLRSFLAEHEIPVPRIYGRDDAHGIIFLEDAGSLSLEEAVREIPREERISLYAEACRLIPKLQCLRADANEVPAFGRFLDAELFESKAMRLIHWALPPLLGRECSDEEDRSIHRLFAEVAAECEAAPRRLSHRDYKAANIHVHRERTEGDRLTLIDLQGAFMAPPEYDLVCLLRDSHVRLGEEEVAQHLAATRALLPDAPSEEEFDRRFTLLTLTRVGKDCAHYIHAATSRGDRRYLPFVSTGLENLRRAADHARNWSPDLARFSDLIDCLELPAEWVEEST